MITWDLTSSSFKCKKMLFKESVDFIQFIATDRVSEVILCGSHKGNGLRMLAYDEQELGDYRVLKSRQGLEGKVSEIRFINDKHLMVQSDDVSGEIFNCWIWNDSASLRLSDKFASNKVFLGIYEFKMILKIYLYFRFNNLKNSKISKQRRSQNMITTCISNGEQHFGGGLWADVVSIQKNSRLPLFWSFHKNALVDKYFQCFDKIRLEEDLKYAKIAQLKRDLKCVCISNCGSFLLSGYSDGWLIKNFIENGQLVRKFKYNDSIKLFHPKEQINQIFLDSINSFVIIVKDDSLVKLDFFSGEELAVLRLNEFDKQMQIDLKNSIIKCDQTNNLIVIVTPCNRILIVNWNNMTLVRSFYLTNQKNASCMTIAKGAKKVLVASKDKRFGVYDIFSAQQVSCFQLDGVLKTIDIREDVWLLAGAYEHQSSVSLWKIDNLDWKVPKIINLPFQSKLIEMGRDLREHYFQNEFDSDVESEKFKSKYYILWINKSITGGITSRSADRIK
jgi:hypothetical protein